MHYLTRGAMMLFAFSLAGCNDIREMAESVAYSNCASTLKQIDQFIASHPDTSPDFIQAIKESRVETGMDYDLVKAAWGSQADQIILRDGTEWHWQARQPKGEWVKFRKGQLVDASTFKPMYLANYESCLDK